MKHLGLWPVAIVVVMIILAEIFPGGRMPEAKQAFAEAELPVGYVAELPNERLIQPEKDLGNRRVVACDYLVTTFQVRFDTIRIANFEPVIIADRYTAPPQPVTLYGKQVNHKPWEGAFSLYLQPLEKGAIVLSVTDWERTGSCYLTIIDGPPPPER